MPENNIRTEIKNIFLGVPGIGKVYDKQKNVFSEDKIKTEFVVGNVLNVFLIGDSSSKEEMAALGSGVIGRQSVTHSFKIDGYYGMNEVLLSRTTFSSLISAIATAFRNNLTLNNTCFIHKYIEVRLNNQEMFCNNLCHHTELVLQVEERI